MFKKSLSMLLCLILLISVTTGCGSKVDVDASKDKDVPTTTKNESNEKESEEESEEAVEEEIVEESYDPFGKYEEPIELTFAFINVSDQKFPSGDDFDNNAWTRVYEEELGIKVKVEWIALTGEQFAQKKSIAIATGQIPDIMLVERNDLPMLIENDRVADLREVFTNYASEDVRRQLEVSDITLDAVTFDGKLAGIPVTRPLDSKFVWVRSDWMDNLGLDAPETMADVYEIARAMTEDDPDQNGQDDTFGFPLDNNLKFYGTPYFASYGAYPRIWVEKDGGIAYGAVQPEAKEALKALNEMYTAGLMDPEFVIKNRGAVNKDVVAGKFGIMYGERFSSSMPLKNNLNNFPEADWYPVKLPTESGAIAKSPMDVTPSSAWIVNKDFEHPEALIKIINLTYKLLDSSEANPDYDAVTIDGNKISVQKLALGNIKNPSKDVEDVTAVNIALESGDTAGLNPRQKDIYESVVAYQDGDTSSNNWDKFKKYGPDQSSFNMLKELLNDDWVQNNAFFGPPGDTMVKKMGELDKMRDETFIKIIVGEKPLDYFDEFVDNWNKLGGEEITEEVNEWYNNK